jgi:transposase
MQFAENLTDRQAADAVRARIDWKYALSLRLEDVGFDYPILCEFRERLLRNSASERLLDLMLQRFQELKLLKARGKQQANRLELVGETLHHSLNEIAALEPEWLKAWVAPIWFEHYGRSFNEYRLPLTDAEHEELAVTIGRDGQSLLEALEQESCPKALRELSAVEILRRVWQQQYQLEVERLSWRATKDLVPCAELIQSP